MGHSGKHVNCSIKSSRQGAHEKENHTVVLGVVPWWLSLGVCPLEVVPWRLSLGVVPWGLSLGIVFWKLSLGGWLNLPNCAHLLPGPEPPTLTPASASPVTLPFPTHCLRYTAYKKSEMHFRFWDIQLTDNYGLILSDPAPTIPQPSNQSPDPSVLFSSFANLPTTLLIFWHLQEFPTESLRTPESRMLKSKPSGTPKLQVVHHWRCLQYSIFILGEPS